MRSFISIGGIMGRASKKTIAELEKLQTKAVRKLARQRNLQKDLDTDEFHYQYDIWSMDMTKVGPKKAEKIRQELNDYLSPKGAIVRINDRKETDTIRSYELVDGKWTPTIEHHDEYVTLKDLKQMKKDLKATNNFAKVFDKALKSTRVERVKGVDGKVISVPSAERASFGEDPGLLVTSVDVGGKIYGKDRGKRTRHKSANTRERFFRTADALSRKASYFNKDKVVSAKRNFIKVISNTVSSYYARKLRSVLKDVSPVEFYYLQKATEGFQFEFYYDEEDLEEKREVMKSTIQAFKDGHFKENYEEFRKILQTEGIIDGED